MKFFVFDTQRFPNRVCRDHFPVGPLLGATCYTRREANVAAGCFAPHPTLGESRELASHYQKKGRGWSAPVRGWLRTSRPTAAGRRNMRGARAGGRCGSARHRPIGRSVTRQARRWASGMGLVIEGAVQQAAQWERQSILFSWVDRHLTRSAVSRCRFAKLV